MGVLTFRMRGETEHPEFVASEDVAAHCRWAVARGERSCTVTEEDGSITEMVLDHVLWVRYAEGVTE